jgi:nucleotide-binding universal stress UspA family protein
MKSILVSVDGSPYATRAMSIACDLAAQHQANLKLLHVLMRDKDPSDFLNLPIASEIDADALAALKELAAAPSPELTAADVMRSPNASGKVVPDPILEAAAKAVLQSAASQAADRGLDCQILDAKDGAPADCIIAAAKEANVDAIVMGSRGVRMIDAMTIGSASQQVCNKAPCVCIIVH